MVEGVSGMRSLELERLAVEVRNRAQVDDENLERAPQIALRVLGPQALAWSRSMRCSARLDRDDAGYVIVVRRDATDLNFTIAHELGHWALLEIARARLDREAEERAANYLGAAILAPWNAVQYGSRVSRGRKLAGMFGLSQTAMWLRLGEVCGGSRAIVTKNGNVLSRGPIWAQLDPKAVVGFARGEQPFKGLAKAKLRGGIDEGRVALHAK